ncbi:hypothetical protein C482_19249 [Natrialba chahannaoensis JCM 10990]|uniref:Uncharacterized protein n=1 Tax=Natrialba chahannaoensis JCM 10990 TaxID=1227492 RepID=M0A5G6_9EURY|nr:hypothetical protein C482_19249 [Natrialba chahannaoensis JCM 10990]
MFRIWNRHADVSSGTAAQSSVRITLSTAVGSVAIVTEDTAEPIGDMGSECSQVEWSTDGHGATVTQTTPQSGR